MKHLKWFSMFLVFTLVFFGCGNDDDDNIDEFPASYDPTAYIVNQLSLTISSVNMVTEEVLQDVYTVGSAPNDAQIQGDELYVVNTLDGNLQIINLVSGTSDLIDLGEGSSPEKIAFVDDETLYVTAAGTANSVKVVDLASRTVTKEIPVGVAPWGIAVVQGKAYVVNSNYDFTNYVAREGSVSVIDTATDTVVQTIDIGVNPQEIARTPQEDLLVGYDGELAVIDPATDAVVDRIETGISPSGITVRKDGVAFLAWTDWAAGGDGLLALNTNSGTLSHSKSNPLLPEYTAWTMSADSQGNLYVAVPDWDGSSTDKLIVLNENNEQIGTYEVGGGGGAASFVAVRE